MRWKELCPTNFAQRWREFAVAKKRGGCGRAATEMLARKNPQSLPLVANRLGTSRHASFVGNGRQQSPLGGARGSLACAAAGLAGPSRFLARVRPGFRRMRRTGSGPDDGRRNPPLDDELQRALCGTAKGGRRLQLLRLHDGPEFRHCRPQSDAGGTQADRSRLYRLSRCPATGSRFGRTGQTSERTALGRDGTLASVGGAADGADTDKSDFGGRRQARQAETAAALRR